MKKKAEVSDPSRNIFNYQDAENQWDQSGPAQAPVGDFDEAFNFFNYPPNGEDVEENPDWSAGIYTVTPRDVNDYLPPDFTVFDGPSEYTYGGYKMSSTGIRSLIKRAVKMFKESDIEWGQHSGMDDHLNKEPLERRKIASLGDLTDFFRIGKNTLVNKSENDFWSLQVDKEGNVFIEKLYDEKDL